MRAAQRAASMTLVVAAATVLSVVLCSALSVCAQPPGGEAFCHEPESDCSSCVDRSWTDPVTERVYGCLWCAGQNDVATPSHCNADWVSGLSCYRDTKTCKVSNWWEFLLLGFGLSLVFVVTIWALDRTLMAHTNLPEVETTVWVGRSFRTANGVAHARDSGGWCCGIDWLSPRRRFDFGSIAVSGSGGGSGNDSTPGVRSRYATSAEERVEFDAEDAGLADGEIEWSAPALGVELAYPPLVWAFFGLLVVYCFVLLIAAIVLGSFGVASGVLFPALVAPFCWVRRRWRLNLYKSQRSARRRARDAELSRSGLGSDQRFEYDVTWACCVSCTRERGPLHDIERVVVFQTHGPVMALPRQQVSSTLAQAAAEAKRAHEPPSPAAGQHGGGPVKVELVAVARTGAAGGAADHKQQQTHDYQPQPLPVASPPPGPVAVPIAGAAESRDGQWAIPPSESTDGGGAGRYFNVYIILKNMTVELPVIIRAPEHVTRPVYRRLMRLLAVQQSLLSAGAIGGAEPSQQRRVRPASDHVPGAALGGGAADIAGAVLAYRDGDDDVTADESDAPDPRSGSGAAARAAVDAAAAAADADAAEAEREAAAALSVAAAGVSGARVGSPDTGADTRDTTAEHKS